jgi:hypothetical protein
MHDATLEALVAHRHKPLADPALCPAEAPRVALSEEKFRIYQLFSPEG